MMTTVAISFEQLEVGQKFKFRYMWNHGTNFRVSEVVYEKIAPVDSFNAQRVSHLREGESVRAVVRPYAEVIIVE